MLLHIPHSGTDTLGRKIVQFDLDELTDWRTHDLFKHKFAKKLVQSVSRFVCDVERFPDNKEPLFKIGHGICYTKGTRDNYLKVH